MRTCLFLLKLWVTLTLRREKGQHEARCQQVPTSISVQHVHGDHVAGGRLPERLGWLEVLQGDGEAESVAAV